MINKNLPNQLTMLRILLAIFCIFFILENTTNSIYWALLIFAIASFTDYLDGMIAKKYNLQSDFGKLLDPIADKILIIGIFLAFLQISLLNIWLVLIIITREIVITSLRLLALRKGKVLAAEKHGKNKMVSQIFAIFITFMILLLFYTYPANNIVAFLYYQFIDLLMLCVLIITLFSGIYYLWANRSMLKNL